MIAYDPSKSTIGIFPGTSRAEYDAIPAINFSRLKFFRRTAAHAREALMNPRPQSDEQALGTLIHLYLLEPERWQSDVTVMPDFTIGLVDDKGKPYKNPRATNKYKDLEGAWKGQNAGKIIATDDDLAACNQIGLSIAASTIATELMTAPAKNEVAIIWDDPTTKLRCKGLVDRLANVLGRMVVIDIKSTTDASIGAYSRDCAKWGYHIQSAFYLDGLSALHPADRKFMHLLTETDSPHLVAVRSLSGQALAQGRYDYRDCLRQCAECLRTDRWPGYQDENEEVDLPRWAISQEVANGSV